MPDPADDLRDTLARHDLSLPDAQADALERYCRLLWEWNEKLNLTRHTDFEKFVARDLVDSMQLAALLEEAEEVLDVGSGGGVPGVVLAILRPDLTVSLAESVGKKARALDDIVSRLDLPVPVYHARAEDVLGDFRFTTLTARAVGPLWKMLHWFKPHWLSIDRLLAVKGPRWIDERGEARHRGYLAGLELRRAATWRSPAADGDSVILQIEPKA